MKPRRNLYGWLLALWERRHWPEIPKTSTIRRGSRFPFKENIRIGDYVWIGWNCLLHGEGGLRIGTGTIISDEVAILTSMHRYENASLAPYDEVNLLRPVTVGAYVWIGYRALILPGVTIGDGAVVGMGAVVTSDVEPGAVVGGNPARVIKKRDMTKFAELVTEGKGYLKERRPRGLEKRAWLDQRQAFGS